MIPTSIKFTHTALLAFSVLLAFLVLRAMDEQFVLGESARVEVTGSDNKVDSSQVVSKVQSFANAHDVNVGHQVADLHDPGNRQHLYLAVGNPDSRSASWLDDGYPNFSLTFRTDVQPLGEISGLDPRGTYVVFGPSGAANELLAELKSLGLKGQAVPSTSLFEGIIFFMQGAVLWCFLIVALAAMVVVGSGVLLNAKVYGVLRLQGKSFAWILARDMAQLGAFWIRAAAVVAAATLVCLTIYNGLNQPGQFGLIALGLLVVLTVPAFAAHVLTLVLTYRTNILPAIKGEVSATLAMVGAYGLRIPAALLAFAIVISAFTTGQDVAERQASREAFAKIGNATTVLLSGDLSDLSQTAEMDKTVGQWIKRSQSQGEAIVALHYSKLSDFAPGSARVPERDVLVVNNTYLAEQPVLTPSGDRLRGVHNPKVKAQVLIPETLAGNADEFTASITGWLKFQAKIADSKLDAAQVQTVATRSDQTVFTYGSGMESDQQTEALVQDPIIIVVPESSGIFSNQQYTAYATQAGIIFKDPGDVRAAVSTNVGDYLVAMSPVAQNAADEYQKLIGEFRLDLFNVIAAMAVLFITAISVSFVYSRKNAQALFVKYISGWTFTQAYRPLLALEIGLAVALIGATVGYTWNTIHNIRALKAQGIPPPPGVSPPLGGWTPAVMLAIAILGVVAVFAVLTVSHRRLVMQRAMKE